MNVACAKIIMKVYKSDVKSIKDLTFLPPFFVRAAQLEDFLKSTAGKPFNVGRIFTRHSLTSL